MEDRRVWRNSTNNQLISANLIKHQTTASVSEYFISATYFARLIYVGNAVKIENFHDSKSFSDFYQKVSLLFYEKYSPVTNTALLNHRAQTTWGAQSIFGWCLMPICPGLACWEHLTLKLSANDKNCREL